MGKTLAESCGAALTVLLQQQLLLGPMFRDSPGFCVMFSIAFFKRAPAGLPIRRSAQLHASVRKVDSVGLRSKSVP